LDYNTDTQACSEKRRKRRTDGCGREREKRQRETERDEYAHHDKSCLRRKGNSAERSDCISEHFDGFGSKD
jgi:hypothetical protein